MIGRMWVFLSALCTLTGAVLTLVPVVYLSWYALRAREWNPLQTDQPGLKEILAAPADTVLQQRELGWGRAGAAFNPGRTSFRVQLEPGRLRLL